MSLDLSILAALCPPRKPRRPVAEQMLSIRGRDVRSLVEVNQQTVRLPQRGIPFPSFGGGGAVAVWVPEAAAAMNARQREARENRPTTEPQLDRGATGGWHLDLVFPVCAKPCRKLFSPGWSERIRPSARPWACRRCHRVTYASSNRPRSSNRPQTSQLSEQETHGCRHPDLEGFHGPGARGCRKHLCPTGHPAGSVLDL
jgi:hypothetical protein